MNKLEIELTDDQLSKVKQLKENGISVGDAVDMLFELQEKALSEIAEIENEETGIIGKVKETAFDVDHKAEALDENYGENEKTYEMKVQDVKHKVSWAKDFFKF